MDVALAHLWAKSADGRGLGWHPLILHLLDVAASADAILAREPESTRKRMGEILGLEWEEARASILLVIACHDLGKTCPSFQAKWPERPPVSGLRLPRRVDKRVNHGFVGQLALTELLRKIEWPDGLAELAADAVACHHGSRASETDKDNAASEIHVGRGERLEEVRSDWHQARAGLFDALRGVFQPGTAPLKQKLTGPDFMLLAGLTSFADWIGSNEEWFRFGIPADCENLPSWFTRRRAGAEQALDAIGWSPRGPLSSAPQSFEEVFPFPPRPLQQAVVDALTELKRPAVLLIEAPMGEGKTEAAFFAHLELQRRFGHRGMYVALPTKATGNAMFTRTLKFLRSQGANRSLDLQLLHGGKLLNDEFKQVRVSGIHDPTKGGEVRAAEWFTRKKRALLSEYGVGTVDQALLTILPVRHNFVRLWGLANRVVVLDEIHAYDDYTGTLLVDLMRWLLALGSSVVLLSATLSPSMRRRLAQALGSNLPEEEQAYPRLSVFHPGQRVVQRHFEPDLKRRLTLRLQGIPANLPSMHAALAENLPGAGLALALVNTVQRAQELYRVFPEGVPLTHDGQRIGKRLPDRTEVLLFHARFPADRRQVREEHARNTFGEESERGGRRILIATQVAEQSLDLDFDLIVTDLAPIDLVLQRAGRLWRHSRVSRPLPAATLLVAGLVGDEPPSFLGPLWWGMVYRQDLLLRTWYLLRARTDLTLPDEIDALVQAVYEDRVEIPASLEERLDKATSAGEGSAFAMRQQAKIAIIGFPDDASWNDPARFVLYDEDQPGVHRTLMAQTRLGQESAVAIPLRPEDGFRPDVTPDDGRAKEWFVRAVSLSRQRVVQKLRGRGVPDGWTKSPLLRNSYPLVLDGSGRWLEDATVRLDEDLGLVYESKEPR
jgi:CRISPR-associated endonuclease/helicase Cas3